MGSPVPISVNYPSSITHKGNVHWVWIIQWVGDFCWIVSSFSRRQVTLVCQQEHRPPPARLRSQPRSVLQPVGARSLPCAVTADCLEGIGGSSYTAAGHGRRGEVAMTAMSMTRERASACCRRPWPSMWTAGRAWCTRLLHVRL